MIQSFRIAAAAFLIFSILSLLDFSSVFAGGAFMYTDDPQEEGEDTEYLDEDGNVIKQYEYEEELRRQAEQLQKSATVPFGKSNTNFGRAKPKMLEMKTINSQFSSLENKSKEAEVAKETSSGSGVFDPPQNESQTVAPAKAKPAPSKPRVLIS